MEEIPQLSDEDIGLRAVQVPDGLEGDVKNLVDGLLEDRRKLKGALEKSTHAAKTTTKSLREERFARLQAKHPQLKEEMFEGIAPEKWEEHVTMWTGALGGQTSTTAQATTEQQTQTNSGAAIDPQTGQPVPERTNVVSPAVAEAMTKFFETVNQGGQVIASQTMTFEDAEKRLAVDPSFKTEYERMVEQGKVLGMPKISSKGGRVIVGG